MSSVIYERIKELCKKNQTTISRLEIELEFGSSCINKWKTSSSPSIDKVIKVASHFDVSVDYLLGLTDIEGSVSEILGDEDILSLQRAREKMSDKDKERMMKMLKVGFDYAFAGQEEDNS